MECLIKLSTMVLETLVFPLPDPPDTPMIMGLRIHTAPLGFFYNRFLIITRALRRPISTPRHIMAVWPYTSVLAYIATVKLVA
jgi:hypothetical protein